MRKTVQRLSETTPTRGIMFLLGLGLVLWGIWVGNPFVQTFDTGFYRLLDTVATESAWSSVALIAGLLRW